MNPADFLTVTWLAVDPERSGKHLAPLTNRLDQAAALFFTRRKEVPNVVLLRGADLADAPREHQSPLPNGKTARLTIEPAPWGGDSREILIARRKGGDAQ